MIMPLQPLLPLASPFANSINASFSTNIDASRRVWTDPVGVQSRTLLTTYNRAEYYNRLWNYYMNIAFDDIAAWQSYRERFGLYRFHRSVYNPTFELVEFYVNHMYPGFLTINKNFLPEGTKIAIEFAANTDPNLLEAINQFWIWSNFQTQKDKIVRLAAALGNCLVEVIDDVQAQKVYTEVWWPSHVVGLVLDQRDNVRAYSLQYRIPYPDNAATYVVRKDVTEKEIRYFRDNEPYDVTGNGAIIKNPYGFAPAVWVRHTNTSELFGLPVIGTSLGKIDELNSLVSRAHDRLFMTMTAPIVVAGGGTSGDLDDLDVTNPKKRPTSEDTAATARERIHILEAPAGTTVSTIPLEVGSTLNWVKELIGQIESGHRELAMYRQLSRMSVTSGPAVEILMGDIIGKVSQAQSSYDEQYRKLFQMAISIGGFRANDEQAWGPKEELTPQRQKFLPYNLDSYQKGLIDLTLLPRQLIPRDPGADATILQTRSLTIQNLFKSGWSQDELYRVWGYTEDKVQELKAEKEQQVAQAAAQAAIAAGQAAAATTSATIAATPTDTGTGTGGTSPPPPPSTSTTPPHTIPPTATTPITPTRSRSGPAPKSINTDGNPAPYPFVAPPRSIPPPPPVVPGV